MATNIGLFWFPKVVVSVDFSIKWIDASIQRQPLTDLMHEHGLRAALYEIHLTLSNAKWLSAVDFFTSGVWQDVINGITSDQSYTNGWDNKKSGIPFIAFNRDSDSLIRIRIQNIQTYNIAASETLTAVVPAAAFQDHDQDVTATPTHQIEHVATNENAMGWFNGSITGSDNDRYCTMANANSTGLANIFFSNGTSFDFKTGVSGAGTPSNPYLKNFNSGGETLQIIWDNGNNARYIFNDPNGDWPTMAAEFNIPTYFSVVCPVDKNNLGWLVY